MILCSSSEKLLEELAWGQYWGQLCVHTVHCAVQLSCEDPGRSHLFCVVKNVIESWKSTNICKLVPCSALLGQWDRRKNVTEPQNHKHMYMQQWLKIFSANRNSLLLVFIKVIISSSIHLHKTLMITMRFYGTHLFTFYQPQWKLWSNCSIDA